MKTFPSTLEHSSIIEREKMKELIHKHLIISRINNVGQEEIIIATKQTIFKQLCRFTECLLKTSWNYISTIHNLTKETSIMKSIWVLVTWNIMGDICSNELFVSHGVHLWIFQFVLGGEWCEVLHTARLTSYLIVAYHSRWSKGIYLRGCGPLAMNGRMFRFVLDKNRKSQKT